MALMQCTFTTHQLLDSLSVELDVPPGATNDQAAQLINAHIEEINARAPDGQLLTVREVFLMVPVDLNR